MDKQVFGRVFKSERAKRFKTQVDFIKDFEEKTGIKLLKSAVSMYEKGSRVPEDNLKGVLCDYFGVTLDYFHGRSTVNLDMVYRTADTFYDLLNKLSEEDKKQAIKYMVFLSMAKEDADGES